MKIIDNIQEGDLIKLTAKLPKRGAYTFAGYARMRDGKWIVSKESDWGMIGYILGLYDWEHIENFSAQNRIDNSIGRVTPS